MKNQVVKIALFAGFLAFSVNMNAQEKVRVAKKAHTEISPKEVFAISDTNKDGFITKDELKENEQRRMLHNFDSFDADKDNKISKDELVKGVEKRKAMVSKKGIRAERPVKK